MYFYLKNIFLKDMKIFKFEFFSNKNLKRKIRERGILKKAVTWAGLPGSRRGDPCVHPLLLHTTERAIVWFLLRYIARRPLGTGVPRTARTLLGCPIYYFSFFFSFFVFLFSISFSPLKF
jgi:hypothetical protein